MFWIRLRSSIILVILALITLLAGGKILLAMMIFLSVIAYRELAGATGVGRQEKREGLTEATLEKREINGLEIVGIAGIIFYYLLLEINMETGLLSVQTGILLMIILLSWEGCLSMCSDSRNFRHLR